MINECGETWINHADGASMCALTNGTVGWMMFLEPGDEIGYRSHNPLHAGSDDEMIQYVLENGQMDEYPALWAIPLDDVRRAMGDFADTGMKPDWVEWHRN